MNLWLCFRFSQWPLDSQTQLPEPAVVVEKQRIIAFNAAAKKLGITFQQTQAHALQLAAETKLITLERKVEQEQRCLEQLHAWAYRYTSTVYSDFGTNLLLRIDQSLRLFRGLDALLKHIQIDFAHHPYTHKLGLAHSPIGAWLATYLRQEYALSDATDTEKLGGLNIALLQNRHPKDTQALQRVGIHTLSALFDLPLEALRKRSSKHFMEDMERLKGLRQTIIPDYHLPPRFHDRYRFGYEVSDNEELWPAINYLLDGLSAFLQKTQHRTSVLTWHLQGIHRYRESFTLRSSQPHIQAGAWLALMAVRLETLTLKETIETLSLECNELEPLQNDTVDLLGNHQSKPKYALTDHLRTRLGHQAVQYIRVRDEHIPEYAHQNSTETPSKSHKAQAPSRTVPSRPVWLLSPPVTTQSSKAKEWIHGELTLMLGPERIEDYWWEHSQCRDYYIALDEQRYRFWVFRDRHTQEWFLHGIFD